MKTSAHILITSVAIFLFGTAEPFFAQDAGSGAYGKQFSEFAKQQIVRDNIHSALLRPNECDRNAANESLGRYLRFVDEVGRLREEPLFIDSRVGKNPFDSFSSQLAKIIDGEPIEFPANFDSAVEHLHDRTQEIIKLNRYAVEQPLCVRSINDGLKVSSALVYYWLLLRVELIHRCRLKDFDSLVKLLELQRALADRYLHANDSLLMIKGLHLEHEMLSNLRIIHGNFEIPLRTHKKLMQLVQNRPATTRIFHRLCRMRLRSVVPFMAPLGDCTNVKQVLRTHAKLLVPNHPELRESVERQIGMLASDFELLLKDHPNPFDFSATLRLFSDLGMEQINSYEKSIVVRDIQFRDKLEHDTETWPPGVTLDPVSVLPLTLGAKYQRMDQKTIDQFRPKLAKIDNVLGRFLVASWESPAVGPTFRRLQTKRAGTMLLMAIMQYWNQHGGLPCDLTDLVRAGFFEDLPRDFQGNPFRYSVENKLLWSVGEDETDDGGVDDHLGATDFVTSIKDLSAAAKRQTVDLKRLRKTKVLTGDTIFRLNRQRVMLSGHE